MFDDVQRIHRRAELYDQVCQLNDKLFELLCEWLDNDPDILPGGTNAPPDDGQFNLPFDDPDNDIPF